MQVRKVMAIAAVVAFTFGMVMMAGPAIAKTKKITVAYFPGWPGTFEYGWAKGMFEKEMGIKVNFREFGSGAEMTTSLLSISKSSRKSLYLSATALLEVASWALNPVPWKCWT